MAQNVHRQATSPVSFRPPAVASARRGFFRRFWFPAVLLLSIAAGGLTGIVAAYKLNYSEAASEVAALATYSPSVVTRVYADDGQTVIGEFALERRIPLKYEEIPEVAKKAILAVEDTRFYHHIGLDPIRIAGVVVKNLSTGSREGGSTLTQQLTKNLFLTREQTLTRKLREWVMALQIERFYTKNQIMEMYANHTFLGARAYGLEAASETYFGKQAKDMTLEEAALLAGIPRAPSQYSPTVNMERAKERRDLVLELMARNNYVTPEQAAAAKMKPIKLADAAFNPPKSTVFDYPVEEIRQYLEDRYTTRVAQGGLAVYSTINIAAQKKAAEAVRNGLHWYDRTHGSYRSEYKNIAADANGSNNANAQASPQQLANYTHPDWYHNQFEPNTFVTGLVTKVDAARNEATVRFANYRATLTVKDMGRAAGRLPKTEFKPGYLAEFRIKESDHDNRTLKVDLSQVPAAQGAMVTLNSKTGEVVAMIGGYDFYTNRFNNATQAYRQTGSCFKPFIYAAAVEWGLTPETPITGAPIKHRDWQPHNYDGSLGGGDVPMKTALAQSKNIQAIHLLDMIGIQTGAQMVRRFGITVPMAPYLPSALGATEVPLDQMVSAYSVFPNKGVRVEPHLVRRVVGRDGNVLEEWEKTTYKVVSPYVALTMVKMMRGVVEGGTAAAAQSVGVQLAGKTGTVNDQTDVWFIGYTPTYVTGVWMGYPGRKKPLGSDMTGGRGALPIFVEFMKDYLKDKDKEKFEEAPKRPEDIRELFLQRQRELAEMRAAALAKAQAEGLPVSMTDINLEKVTIPPLLGDTPDSGNAPSTDATKSEPNPDKKEDASPSTPRASDTYQTPAAPPPPPASTRPREALPQKKGKKGEEEP
ncbi:MAG: PBP1A family penicillin-binding protein [Pyrinomonadaceae bacterium]